MRNAASCISDPNAFSSCSGSRYHNIYTSVLGRDGLFDLVVQDQVDTCAKIQSELPFTDMTYIISRLSVGDTSVLNSKPAMFGDFSEMPRTLTDAYNLLQSAERHFYSMRPEVRAEFNGSFTEFLAAGSRSDFEDVIKNISSKLDAVSKVGDPDAS